jgi:hypothetical protein
MECNHCVTNATPDGEHMSIDTFIRTLIFLEKCQSPFIIVSGGEPLEHPKFFELMKMVSDFKFKMVSILSNGMFLDDNELRERVFSLGAYIQITNDERYYPKRITKYEHPLVTYADKLRIITPLGRAVDNNIKPSRLAPMCFNLRSATRTYSDLLQGILILRSRGKMCTPSISTNGMVVAGESPLCHKIGTVETPFAELTKNLLTMKCNKCGLEDALNPAFRNAIGV